MGKIMQEMQSVLTDPEKLKTGLEQFATNPALKGLADSIPGMKEMLEDPEQLAEQASKVSEVMQNLQDPEKLQKMMGGDGSGLENMQEAMQKVAQLMQGGGGLG